MHSMFRVGVECLVSLSSCIGWQYAIAAGSESPPRTEIKPELFQKERDRAKNESFAEEKSLASRLEKVVSSGSGPFHRWLSKLPLSSLPVDLPLALPS